VSAPHRQKFKPTVSKEEIARHYRNDLNLEQRIPFILGWRAYNNLSTSSKTSFPHSVVIYLETSRDLQTFLDHPQAAEVSKLQAPLVEETLILDFEDDRLASMLGADMLGATMAGPFGPGLTSADSKPPHRQGIASPLLSSGTPSMRSTETPTTMQPPPEWEQWKSI